MKMVLSATLTQDPTKLSQLQLHHPLFLTTGHIRYKLPEHLHSFKLVYKIIIFYGLKLNNNFTNLNLVFCFLWRYANNKWSLFTLFPFWKIYKGKSVLFSLLQLSRLTDFALCLSFLEIWELKSRNIRVINIKPWEGKF